MFSDVFWDSKHLKQTTLSFMVRYLLIPEIYLAFWIFYSFLLFKHTTLCPLLFFTWIIDSFFSLYTYNKIHTATFPFTFLFFSFFTLHFLHFKHTYFSFVVCNLYVGIIWYFELLVVFSLTGKSTITHAQHGQMKWKSNGQPRHQIWLLDFM